MPTTSVVRILLAVSYLAIYVGVFAVAWQGRHGVGGGMALTAPIMLGLPWTPLVLAAFVLSGFKPGAHGVAAALPLIAFFIVPPTLNVIVILFAGRRRRPWPSEAEGGGSRSARRAPDGREG